MTPLRISSVLLSLSVLFGNDAYSQTAPERGWEASIGFLQQGGEDIGFNNGASLRTDDDIGVVFGVGYNFNSKLDLIVGFESVTVGYDLVRQSATTPGVTQQIIGDYESFAPVVKLNYNFLNRSFTPFVTAGVGWSFIDTNIPTGDVFVDCWFDPWYGYFCAPFAETKTTEALTYQAGIGARWKINEIYGLRFEYNKQWVDFDGSRGTPNFDQFKLTLVLKYW